MLMAPNTGKRGEKRIEGGDELDARQGVDSSAHLKLEEDTVLTAGTASRCGTRLSSKDVMLHICNVSQAIASPTLRTHDSVADL